MDNVFFKEYFASLNSGCGFKNYFPKVLSGIGGKLILKGTPGSGKSGIMKKIAEHAHRNGYDAELIFCSSDPDSLDGVVIRDLDFAVIDGTAPHTADPKYPVVSDFIFDTAKYMNENKLSAHKDEIISLSKEKNAYYELGYRFLSCRSAMRTLDHSLISDSILYDKMAAAVNRLYLKESKKQKKSGETNKKKEISVRVSASFTSGGITVKNSFSAAKAIYVITEKYDVAPIFLSMMLSKARSESESVFISPDPFDPDMLCALYLPSSETLFISERYVPDSKAEMMKVNSERFVDKDTAKRYKTKRKFIKECIRSFENDALEEFSNAMKKHMEAENIYTSAMDYKKLDASVEELIGKIFKKG